MSLCEEAAQQLQQAYGAWSLRFRCQRAEVKAMPSYPSPCSVRNRRRVVVCIFAAQQHLAPSDGGRGKPSAAEAITTIVGETGQHSKTDARGRCGNTWDIDCFGMHSHVRTSARNVLSDSAIHCVWTSRVTETAKRRDIYLQVFFASLPVGGKRITPHYRVEIWGRVAVSTVLGSVVCSQ
jgi:hypothetical protein